MSSAALDRELAYTLLLGNRNRAGMPPPAPIDEIWRNRIDAAIAEIERRGINLTNDLEDLMLVSDYASWLIDQREKGGGMPDWLRCRLSQRWISQREATAE